MSQKQAITGGRERSSKRSPLFRKSKSDLVVMVQNLRAENEDLRLQLGMDSTNSSKPPSSDSLAARGKREQKGGRKGSRKRKPGGQPGHKGHHRKLLDLEDVDDIQTLIPGQCGHCGTDLTGDDPNPLRHQVWRIPEIKPRVIEYRRASLRCSCCGENTRAPLPAGVPAGSFDPRTMAVVAYLTGTHRVSKRGLQEMFQTLFNIPIGLGSISAIESKVSDALEAPVDEAKDYIQSEEKVIYADETGWREGRQKAWLWVAATPSVVVFMIHLRRSKEAAMELLGKFKGVLVTDRAGAYNDHPGKRQFCWAHLLRDFVAYSLRTGEAGRIGRKLVIKSCTLFRLWNRVRDGTLSESQYQSLMGILCQKVEALLAEGELCNHKKVAASCKLILKHRSSLWVFVMTPGVDPTNNLAERTIRPAVMWRKGSFGTHSPAGSRYVARVLTVVATGKAQDRDPLRDLESAYKAHLTGSCHPSLLPEAVA